MKKFSQVLILFLFIQCLGVKNKKNAENLSFLGLLTGGVSNSATGTTHNGNPLSGTGNGTSNFVSTEIKSETGGIVNLGAEMSLSIPADSIESNSTISVSKVGVNSIDSTITPIQNGYKFGPENLNFFEPATLKVCYNPEFLKQKKLNEKDIQVFYVDPDTKELASVGGTVDLVAHCVSAKVEHFSTYVPAVSTNINTTVSAPTLLPARPISGQPLRLRTRIIPANGATITSAILNYRVKGQSNFNSVALIQDNTDVTNKMFYYTIPASDISLSGLEYFLQVTDSNNKTRRVPNTNFTSRTITKTLNITTPLRYNIRRASINMADGTFRNLSLQVLDNDGLWQTTFSESNDLTGNIGVLNVIGNTIRFTAETIGTGTLTSTYGGNQISLNINVVAGALASIKFLDGAGVVITNPLNIIQGQTANLQILGYDVMGNLKTINPTITATNGIGTFNKPTGIFTATNTPNLSGQLTASVGTITGSISVNTTPNSFTISGIVRGLEPGNSVTIQNNGGDDLVVTQNGSFSFATNVLTGNLFDVRVKNFSSPRNSCHATDSWGVNTGRVGSSNVTTALINCHFLPENSYSINPDFSFNINEFHSIRDILNLNNKYYYVIQNSISTYNSNYNYFFKDSILGTEIPTRNDAPFYKQFIYENKYYFTMTESNSTSPPGNDFLSLDRKSIQAITKLYSFDGLSIQELFDYKNLLTNEEQSYLTTYNNPISCDTDLSNEKERQILRIGNYFYIKLFCHSNTGDGNLLTLTKVVKINLNEIINPTNIFNVYSYRNEINSFDLIPILKLYQLAGELYLIKHPRFHTTLEFMKLNSDDTISNITIPNEILDNTFHSSIIDSSRHFSENYLQDKILFFNKSFTNDPSRPVYIAWSYDNNLGWNKLDFRVFWDDYKNQDLYSINKNPDDYPSYLSDFFMIPTIGMIYSKPIIFNKNGQISMFKADSIPPVGYSDPYNPYSSPSSSFQELILTGNRFSSTNQFNFIHSNDNSSFFKPGYYMMNNRILTEFTPIFTLNNENFIVSKVSIRYNCISLPYIYCDPSFYFEHTYNISKF